MKRPIMLALLGGALLAAPVAAQYPYGNYDQDAATYTALVASWYQRFLGRAPDPGMSAWVQQLRDGNPPDAVLAGILGSQEYYNQSGGTPEGFVQKLYRDLLGRRPSPAQYNYWLRRRYTTDRETIAHQLLSRYPGAWQDQDIDDQYDYRRPYHRFQKNR